MRAHFHPGNPFGRSLNIKIRKHAPEKFQIGNLAIPHSFNGIICSPPLASFVFQDNCGSRIIFRTVQFLPLNFPRLRRLTWPLSKSLTKKQTKLTIIKVKASFVAHKSAKTMHRIFQLAFLGKNIYRPRGDIYAKVNQTMFCRQKKKNKKKNHYILTGDKVHQWKQQHPLTILIVKIIRSVKTSQRTIKDDTISTLFKSRDNNLRIKKHS